MPESNSNSRLDKISEIMERKARENNIASEAPASTPDNAVDTPMYQQPPTMPPNIPNIPSVTPKSY